MKLLLLFLVVLSKVSAQPLPVVPMQMDPDQLFRSLREKKPVMPMADCTALGLWECHPDDPRRLADVSLRWVQLDDDPELEAVLVIEGEAEDAFVAYVFDKQRTWNLVGSFFCWRRRCDASSLIRVQKLTEDSPPLLLCYRDLGGSGQVLLTTEGFHLRDGKLWPAFQAKNYEEVGFAHPYSESQRVLTSHNRLVIHTILEKPPGKTARNGCEVWRWDPAKYSFVPVPAERGEFCDPKSGKPIQGKSFPTGLPIHR
jgi:hypothetical protein